MLGNVVEKVPATPVKEVPAKDVKPVDKPLANELRDKILRAIFFDEID